MEKQKREILTSIFNELKAMTRDEFLKELELYGDGDVATFLLESGALEVRTIEAEAFAARTPISISAVPEYKFLLNSLVNSDQFPKAGNDYYYNATTIQISLFDFTTNETYTTKMCEGHKWKIAA